MGKKNRFAAQVNIKNRRASYEFEFLEKYVAGMVLRGTEIKSIREGKVTLTDGFCYFRGTELFAKQISISPYSHSSHYNHESTRERKLLLSKQELTKLKKKSEEKGLAIVPLRIFVNERGLAKIEIALGKGKKLHDKRDSIKDKDIKRDLERIKY